MTTSESEIIPGDEQEDKNIIVHESEPIFLPSGEITDDNASSSPPEESDTSNPEEPAVPITENDQDIAQEQPVEPEITDEEFDALRAIVSLLVGGAIEGTSQLTKRLELYEENIKQAREDEEADGDNGNATVEPVPEDELDLLRYALVGFIFDTQSRVRRTLPLLGRLLDKSVRVSSRAARPVTNSRLFSPIQRRYNEIAQKGEDSLQKWIDLGRQSEPLSRDLAKMTYTNIVDEFISQLAENPEINSLVQAQSIGLATEVRDEFRGRGVTADGVLEGLVRRVLRRAPRAELPEPPPEVQQWAGVTMEDYRAYVQHVDESSTGSDGDEK